MFWLSNLEYIIKIKINKENNWKYKIYLMKISFDEYNNFGIKQTIVEKSKLTEVER